MKRTFIVVLATITFIGLMAVLSLLFVEPDRQGLDLSIYVSPGKAAIKPAELTPKIDSTSKPMNVIVILADDLGYGDIGVNGAAIIATPALDQLAAEGMRFTQFYASAALCSPSRAGLLTGRYPARSGVTSPLPSGERSLSNQISYKLGTYLSKFSSSDMMGAPSAVLGLPESELTLAESLQANGYRTMVIGKWHLGDFTIESKYHPSNHGFERFVGFNGSNDDFPVAFWRDREEINADIGVDQRKYTRLFTEEAVKFIKEDDQRPFFLYLAHKDPHQPFIPHEEFDGKSEAGPYGDAVEEFDWSIRQVIETLKKNGQDQNTLVLVTSDNGPWFEGSPGGLRGRKGQSYEGGFRVPFIAWAPKIIPAGKVSDEPAMNIDFFPTILGLAGISLPEDRVIDGRNLWPVLSGDAESVGERQLFFFHDLSLEAVRKGDWKYIDQISHYVYPIPIDRQDTLMGQITLEHNYIPENGDNPLPLLGTWPLLYKVSNDQDESYNLLKKYPEKAKTMKMEFDDWSKEFYNNPRGWKN